jgi:hypothetical protein
VTSSKIGVRSDGTATFRSRLPDEVHFESLATRVRAFTLSNDRRYWRKALDALERSTGLEDMAFGCHRAFCAREWLEADRPDDFAEAGVLEQLRRRSGRFRQRR